MSEEVARADANLTALADLHRALSAAYEAAFPGQAAATPRAAIGALVMELGRLREENAALRELVKRAIRHLDEYGEIGTPLAAMAEDLEVRLSRIGGNT